MRRDFLPLLCKNTELLASQIREMNQVRYRETCFQVGDFRHQGCEDLCHSYQFPYGVGVGVGNTISGLMMSCQVITTISNNRNIKPTA